MGVVILVSSNTSFHFVRLCRTSTTSTYQNKGSEFFLEYEYEYDSTC